MKNCLKPAWPASTLRFSRLSWLAWTAVVAVLAIFGHPPPDRHWRKLAQLELHAPFWQSSSNAPFTNQNDGSLEAAIPHLNDGRAAFSIVARAVPDHLKLDETAALVAFVKLDVLGGTELLAADGCAGLVFCRFFLESKNERWFSAATLTLDPGAACAEASMDPAGWLDSNLTPADPHRFKQALKKLERAGLAFGSACAPAAGIFAREGGAVFAILDYHWE